jgi:hypothetical protein
MAPAGTQPDRRNELTIGFQYVAFNHHDQHEYRTEQHRDRRQREHGVELRHRQYIAKKKKQPDKPGN